MDQWISVKDKLPEIGDAHRVLVFVIDYYRDYSFQMVTNRWESGYSNLLRGQNVTHWMPLPEPPK